MVELRRIVSNTIISLLGQGLSWLSTLLLSYAYGHFLGASKFGELYFAITFVSLIGVFVDYGYNNQIIREVAPEPALAIRYFSNMLIIKLGSWIIMYSLMLLVSWLLGYTLEVRILVAICGLDLLCNVIASTFGTLHYAFQKTIFPAIAGILEKGLVTIFGTLLLSAGGGVEVMALVLVVGSLVNLIWQASWFFHHVGISFVIDPKLIGRIVRINIPFLVSGLLTMGYNSIDTVLLSFMTNSTMVGWYGAASRITDAMGFLPNIVILNIMYPVFSKLSTTSDTDLKLALEKSINFLLFCSIPITTVLLVAAPEIIVFLYGGKGFSQAIPALQALAPYVIFLYFNYPLVSLLLSKKLDKKIPVMSVIGLAFNLGLNIFLIPIYRYIGSAVVASLTELLLSFVCIAFTPKHLRPTGSWLVALKAIAASLVMALVILELHTLQIFVLLPIAMLVYIGASLLLGTIPRGDYLAIYHAMRKKVHHGSNTSNDDSPENLVPLYDLPTMLVPAYYNGGLYKRGSLLDIELAVTGKLPIVRLPLAQQRTGLVTNNLSKIPDQLYSPSITSAPARHINNTTSSLDIDMVITEKLPATYLHFEQGKASYSAKGVTNSIICDDTTETNNSVDKEPISDNRGMVR